MKATSDYYRQGLEARQRVIDAEYQLKIDELKKKAAKLYFTLFTLAAIATSFILQACS